MLTDKGYRACLGFIRQALGKSDEHGIRTLKAPVQGGLTPLHVPLQRLNITGLDDRVTLIYLPCNAYIQGYRGRMGVTVFQNIHSIINPKYTLGFDYEYIPMGWQKNIEDKTITLTAVEDALVALRDNATVGKAHMLAICIAFAEGARFSDVEQAIIDGTPVSNAMVKWNQQITAGHARLIQA